MTWNPIVADVDPTAFSTYQNPELFDADWKGFYDSAMDTHANFQADREYSVVKYGDHPRQMMNIYRPAGEVAGRPVILYFHGGGFREGHPAMYDHLAAPWVKAGAVFVSCGYRLTPESSIADACEDGILAIEWAKANAAEYGGDSNRIIMAGHSAGGYIVAVATMTSWRSELVSDGGKVTGSIIMSAPVDLRNRANFEAVGVPEQPHLLPCLQPGGGRVLISYGEPELNKKGVDPLFFKQAGDLLRDGLDQIGVHAEVVTMPDTDHVGSAVEFANPGSPLFAAASRIVFDSKGES